MRPGPQGEAHNPHVALIHDHAQVEQDWLNMPHKAVFVDANNVPIEPVPHYIAHVVIYGVLQATSCEVEPAAGEELTLRIHMKPAYMYAASCWSVSFKARG